MEHAYACGLQAGLPIATATSPDAAWFVRLGQVARTIGNGNFHERLLELLGLLISHDSAWIIRYSTRSAPDVLSTIGVRPHVLDWYRETYSAYDPFARFWRGTSRPGVIVLGQALTPSPESDIYSMLFQIKAGFADELAVMLPVVGGSCLALFIQRNQSSFTEAEQQLARLVYPVLDGMHRAHVGRLFLELKNVADHPGAHPELPTLIVDRDGRELHANRLWREAERRMGGLQALMQRADTEGARHLEGEAGEILRVESFDADFALAPAGRMYVLDAAGAGNASGETLSTIAGMPPITRRERDILALILQGCTTGEIAQRLAIGKGTIKNYRMRLYRKAGVGSERALVALFMPLLGR